MTLHELIQTPGAIIPVGLEVEVAPCNGIPEGKARFSLTSIDIKTATQRNVVYQDTFMADTRCLNVIEAGK